MCWGTQTAVPLVLLKLCNVFQGWSRLKLLQFKFKRWKEEKTVFCLKQKKLKQISVCDSVLFERTKATENVLFCEWTIYIAQNTFTFVLLVGKGTACAYWRGCVGWICASYQLQLFSFFALVISCFFVEFSLLKLDTSKATATFKNVALNICHRIMEIKDLDAKKVWLIGHSSFPTLLTVSRRQECFRISIIFQWKQYLDIELPCQQIALYNCAFCWRFDDLVFFLLKINQLISDVIKLSAATFLIDFSSIVFSC